MEDFDFIKWWGAVLGTLAFAWNVYNGLSNSPKIKVRLRPNTTYPDARVISSEETEHGKVNSLASYCHIELTNVGKVPATVTSIEATHKDNGAGRMFSTAQRFLGHSREKLPLFIQPGQLWSCRLEMEDLYRLAEYGTPEIRVTVSYKEKPIVAKPDITANKSSQKDAQKTRAFA